MDHPRKGEYTALFRRSGTAHIMALSGFHAGLVGLLLFMAGRVLLGSRGGYLFSMAGLVLLLWLAGFRPSLLRAVGMYFLICCGEIDSPEFPWTSGAVFHLFSKRDSGSPLC